MLLRRTAPGQEIPAGGGFLLCGDARPVDVFALRLGARQPLDPVSEQQTLAGSRGGRDRDARPGSA
jgi:hypothetical protein